MHSWKYLWMGWGQHSGRDEGLHSLAYKITSLTLWTAAEGRSDHKAVLVAKVNPAMAGCWDALLAGRHRPRAVAAP